jgi:endonuclease/exonuclease/phosphatase family metal-dependent hydrolase
MTVLQMNLCNSGAAGCFTGRAVARAASVIRVERPDVVALNEICRADVDALAGALDGARPGGTVLTAFEPAFSARTGKEVRCNNGQEFGVGLLVRVQGKNPWYVEDGGLYPMQTRGEQRVWACLYVVASVHACTTHLALGLNGTSLAQCRHLLGTAIPAMRPESEPLPTVVAGDLNLGAADTTPCVPPDYSRTDDGAVQQVMASAEWVIVSHRTIDMRGDTDHPGLLVSVDRRVRQ